MRAQWGVSLWVIYPIQDGRESSPNIARRNGENPAKRDGKRRAEAAAGILPAPAKRDLGVPPGGKNASRMAGQHSHCIAVPVNMGTV